MCIYCVQQETVQTFWPRPWSVSIWWQLFLPTCLPWWSQGVSSSITSKVPPECWRWGERLVASSTVWLCRRGSRTTNSSRWAACTTWWRWWRWWLAGIFCTTSRAWIWTSFWRRWQQNYFSTKLTLEACSMWQM